MVKKARSAIKKLYGMNVPLRHRIALFFSVSCVTLLAGVMTVLTLTGVFSFGARELSRTLRSEHARYSENAGKTLGQIAFHAVQLSLNLSGGIEDFLRSKDLRFSDLSGQMELLQALEEQLAPVLIGELNATVAGGALFALEATVNPILPRARFSRAGMFIRNSENGMTGFDVNKYYIRGFPDIASKKKIQLRYNWTLEFDILQKSWYNKIFEVLGNGNVASLSRHYLWSRNNAAGEEDASGLLCSIPILDANRKIIGVCGLEFRGLQFGEVFSPENESIPGTVHILSLRQRPTVSLDRAVIAGKLDLKDARLEDRQLRRGKNMEDLETFVDNSGNPVLIGISDEIQLYPKDSPFDEERFTLITAIPWNYFVETGANRRNILLTVFALFLTVGIVLSVWISNRILHPLKRQMVLAGNGKEPGEFKTNIPEIDLLASLLVKAHQTGEELEGESELFQSLFSDFIAAVRTLTPTEMILFQYYADGKTTPEIKDLMCVSEATIRTHSSHIYQKLHVSSRNELALYTDLLKKAGKYAEIFP